MSAAPFALGVLLLAPLVTAQDRDVDWGRLSQRFDRNGDGEVTRDEFDRPRAFRFLDKNKDGVLSRADFDEGEEEAGEEMSGAPDAPPSAEGLALYESDVLPILESSCYDCHAETSKRVKGGLKLDSRAALLEGGHSGPAIVPGDPDASLFMEAVHYGDPDFAMPPDGKLDEADLAALAQWIELGAPFPSTGDEVPALPTKDETTIDIEAGRQWWAFRPVTRPEVPTPADADWVWSEVDAFLKLRMEQAGVTPVGDADKASWLRRVTFDLTGLPPTPAELEAFLVDDAAESYAAVVERLLASPRYAERWGRHWLDVARYAESSGKDSNVVYPHAWRYRDWVIDAFEADLPYDQFLSQQLAGDLLPASSDDERAAQQIATGYLAIGPKSHNTRNPVQFTVDMVDEQIDAISRGMLGVTLACARCHDHKFDPIPIEDYYAMAGILGSTETLYGTHRSLGNLRAAELVELPLEARVPNGPQMPSELRRLFERRQEGLERGLANATSDVEDLEPAERLRVRNQLDTLETLEDLLSRFGEDGEALASNRLAMGAREGRGRDARVLERGELEEAGARVARGFPQVLTDEAPSIGRGSGRRELAQWIASEDNPLTARVWVNRVWVNLFGQGIVASEDNFGKSGLLPTHPELLDWMASEFMAQGWSTKTLVRELVLSHAYRLSTEGHKGNERLDPEASLLWHMPPRRLEAEALRDAILFAAGTLELRRPVGSPIGVVEGQPRREGILESLIEDNQSRSVYLPILRDKVPHALECFDAADPSFVTGEREETVVATQALFLMNDEGVMAASDALARRLQGAADNDRDRIELAFQLTLGRDPTSSERSAVRDFLRDFAKIVDQEGGRRRRSGEDQAWSAFAQSLFQSAEFRYRG